MIFRHSLKWIENKLIKENFLRAFESFREDPLSFSNEKERCIPYSNLNLVQKMSDLGSTSCHHLIHLENKGNKQKNRTKLLDTQTVCLRQVWHAVCSMEFKIFLAPTGAQGMLICVCPSVCLCGKKLSKKLNLNLSSLESNQSTQEAPMYAVCREQSKALKEHLRGD